VLALQRKHGLRVLHRGIDLRAVADQPGVRGQEVEVGRGEVRDALGIEALERLGRSGPLRLHHPPADPGLEHRSREHVEIVGQALRPDLLGRFLRLRHVALPSGNFVHPIPSHLRHRRVRIGEPLREEQR